MKVVCVCLAVAVLLAASVSALPYAMPDDPYAPPAPTYGKAEIGRVKMQIYRGPSEHKGKQGYEDVYFAPWGYYVTQPEDLKKVGYH